MAYISPRASSTKAARFAKLILLTFRRSSASRNDDGSVLNWSLSQYLQPRVQSFQQKLDLIETPQHGCFINQETHSTSRKPALSNQCSTSGTRKAWSQ